MSIKSIISQADEHLKTGQLQDAWELLKPYSEHPEVIKRLMWIRKKVQQNRKQTNANAENYTRSKVYKDKMAILTTILDDDIGKHILAERFIHRFMTYRLNLSYESETANIPEKTTSQEDNTKAVAGAIWGFAALIDILSAFGD